jgi:NAD(P)-dependent dehydrogenase (short-subunit alcohol dehydrogenase family)
MTTKSTVLILGASRGLGLAMAEEWLKRDAKVIAAQRSVSRDLSELQGRYPGSVEIETVGIMEAASVHALRERIGHRIDMLFVNAGICKAHEETPSAVDERDFVDMMLTNALSARHAGDPRALLLTRLGPHRHGTSAATLSIEESIPFVVENVQRSRGRAGLRFIDRNGRNPALVTQKHPTLRRYACTQ